MTANINNLNLTQANVAKNYISRSWNEGTDSLSGITYVGKIAENLLQKGMTNVTRICTFATNFVWVNENTIKSELNNKINVFKNAINEQKAENFRDTYSNIEDMKQVCALLKQNGSELEQDLAELRDNLDRRIQETLILFSLLCEPSAIDNNNKEESLDKQESEEEVIKDEHSHNESTDGNSSNLHMEKSAESEKGEIELPILEQQNTDEINHIDTQEQNNVESALTVWKFSENIDSENMSIVPADFAIVSFERVENEVTEKLYKAKDAFKALMDKNYDKSSENHVDHVIYNYLKSFEKSKLPSNLELKIKELHPKNQQAILQAALEIAQSYNQKSKAQQLTEKLAQFNATGSLKFDSKLEVKAFSTLLKVFEIGALITSVTAALYYKYLYEDVSDSYTKNVFRNFGCPMALGDAKSRIGELRNSLDLQKIETLDLSSKLSAKEYEASEINKQLKSIEERYEMAKKAIDDTEKKLSRCSSASLDNRINIESIAFNLGYKAVLFNCPFAMAFLTDLNKIQKIENYDETLGNFTAGFLPSIPLLIHEATQGHLGSLEKLLKANEFLDLNEIEDIKKAGGLNGTEKAFTAFIFNQQNVMEKMRDIASGITGGNIDSCMDFVKNMHKVSLKEYAIRTGDEESAKKLDDLVEDSNKRFKETREEYERNSKAELEKLNPSALKDYGSIDGKLVKELNKLIKDLESTQNSNSEEIKKLKGSVELYKTKLEETVESHKNEQESAKEICELSRNYIAECGDILKIVDHHKLWINEGCKKIYTDEEKREISKNYTACVNTLLGNKETKEQSLVEWAWSFVCRK